MVKIAFRAIVSTLLLTDSGPWCQGAALKQSAVRSDFSPAETNLEEELLQNEILEYGFDQAPSEADNKVLAQTTSAASALVGRTDYNSN